MKNKLCIYTNSIFIQDETIISAPCQNLYFYLLQFVSILSTKPKILYKLLNPFKYGVFVLDWYHKCIGEIGFGMRQHSLLRK